MSNMMIILVVMVGSLSMAVTPPETFEQALQLAKANVSTPEGKTLDHNVASWFGQRHAETMNRCTAGVDDSELVSFDLLVKLGADGRVLKAAVRPETKVATCVLRAVEHDVVSRPPRADYWVRIAMSLKP